MAKNATKGGGREGAVVPHPSAMRRVRVGEVLVQARTALREIVVGAGFQVLTAMLEEDRERLCGPRYQQAEGRRAYRHGSEERPVVLGGRKVRVKKLRVRSASGGGEITLPTWEDITREDPLDERAYEQMLLGVSTRRYGRSLEPLPPGVESIAVSRSSVSRRFVARTAAKVEEFLSRPLDADFPVVMIDGTGLGDHVLVVALGIDSEGHKHVLGVVEGSTESHGVCQALLRDLIERGLVVERARLFVIDGGKGLRKAIRETFAQWALIQRCQVHKLRNVLDHLPGSKRAVIGAALRKAWSADSQAQGRQQLEAIASRLEAHHPGAVAALHEGLEETLTLLALGAKGALHRTLCSTNPIENLQGALKRVAKRVKRWRGGSMALRWAATALMEAEKRFRRIRGHRELATLNASLLSFVGDPIRKSA
jgi:putative transposase